MVLLSFMDLFNSLVFVAQIYEDLRLGVSCSEKRLLRKPKRFQSLSRQKRQSIREEVLRLYAETDLSYGEIAEINGVQVRTIEYIVCNFASELPEIIIMRKKRTEAGREDYDKLRAEAERLRKELREQKMRAEALDTMIDVAEEMFDIPIRRKTDDKR